MSHKYILLYILQLASPEFLQLTRCKELWFLYINFAIEFLINICVILSIFDAPFWARISNCCYPSTTKWFTP